MANNTLKGLTIEIGGDTTKLGKALEDVNKRGRELSTELGQINKLLKLDPGNTELLAQKQKVLSEAIANTSKKLDTLKEAEKQVQKQFERGEVSEEQVRALQREIIQTESKMESYQRAAKETAEQTEKVGTEAKDTSTKVEGMGDKLKKVGSVATTAFAAIATAAASAAAALAKCSADAAAYADNILAMSTVTGISTDKLQEYSYAAELVDVSVETITKSHAKNIKSMAAAQNGTALMVEAYEKLGVSVKNGNGTLRDGETVYWEVIDALGKMKNETERDAIAMQILGKSAQELNPLIEAGSARMNELAQEAHEVGAVMNDETLNSMGSLDDAIQRLNGSAGAAKNALGSVLLPEMTMLATEGAALLSEFTKNLNETGGGMEGFVATVDLMADDIGGKIGELLGGIVEKAGELLPSVVKVCTALVVSAAKAIVAELPNLVQTIAKVLVSNIPVLIAGALELFMALVDAIDLLLPPLIEAIPDIVTTIVDSLIEAIPTLIDGALVLLLAIVDAIPLLIDKLVPLIPSIVVAISNALIKATPQLLNAAVTLFGALVKAIPKACASLLKALPQIASTILNFLGQLPSKVLSIGGNLVAGLWQGISDKANWLKNKIKSWVGNITDFLKRLFGINSPSKVTAYMGEMLDEGFAKGIKDNTDAPVDAMGDLSKSMLNEAGGVDGLAIERHINHSYSVSAGEVAAQNASTLSKLDQILEAIKSGKVITINGDTLVGATVNTMNTALGQRRVLVERGAI